MLHKDILKYILFVYAVTGYDTTSALNGLREIKAVDLIKRNPCRKLVAEKEKIVLAMHSLGNYYNFNEARYFKFTSLTRISTLKLNFDLAKLPTTSEPCHKHLTRAYFQVPWGWRSE